LVAAVMDGIVDQETVGKITFDDIAGCEEAKTALHEAVQLPLALPELFTGITSPWRAVLLYGPPGTGKTLLARAAAGVRGATFLNVSVATVTSKWRGENEKFMRIVFDVARHHSPAVVFFDEIDGLASQRGDGGGGDGGGGGGRSGGSGEHEASRRSKIELLTQMDGLTQSSEGEGEQIVVLATTNRPWDLDEAIRRRLERRIYVGLPDTSARVQLFELCLKGVEIELGSNEVEGAREAVAEAAESVECVADGREEGGTGAGAGVGGGGTAESNDVGDGGGGDTRVSRLCEALAAKTEGYSGSDIKVVCREAAMRTIRRLTQGKSTEELVAMRGRGEGVRPPVTVADLEGAIANTKPSVASSALACYEKWTEEHAAA